VIVVGLMRLGGYHPHGAVPNVLHRPIGYAALGIRVQHVAVKSNAASRGHLDRRLATHVPACSWGVVSMEELQILQV
jgi:hypothetical protein